MANILDRRDKFKNKKKARSFQSRRPLVSIDDGDEETKDLETIQGSPLNERTIKRSLSTADVHYVLHNAVITEDRGTLERVLQEADRENTTFDVNNESFTTGMTALHQACYIGNLECVKMLIEAGSNLFLKTKDGFSPLQVANNCGNFEVAEYLISKGVQDDIKNGIVKKVKKSATT